jgi:hypothetical protein
MQQKDLVAVTVSGEQVAGQIADVAGEQVTVISWAAAGRFISLWCTAHMVQGYRARPLAFRHAEHRTQ